MVPILLFRPFLGIPIFLFKVFQLKLFFGIGALFRDLSYLPYASLFSKGDPCSKLLGNKEELSRGTGEWPWADNGCMYEAGGSSIPFVCVFLEGVLYFVLRLFQGIPIVFVKRFRLKGLQQP